MGVNNKKVKKSVVSGIPFSFSQSSAKWISDPEDLILVTGANGFIGTSLIKRLQDMGFQNIRCFVRPSGDLSQLAKTVDTGKLEIVHGNLLHLQDCEVATSDVSIVYHLAAGIEKTFAGSFMNSVVTTRNLLDSVLGSGNLKRFVNVSSFSVYSNITLDPGEILDENCPIETEFMERFEAYCFGKVKQDEIVMRYGQDHGLPFVIVRPGAVFGPGKSQLSARVGIDTFGFFMNLGRKNRLPLTYVDNCADAIILAGLISDVEDEIFNVVDDHLPYGGKFLKDYKKNARNFMSVPVPYTLFKAFCRIWEGYSKWSRGQLPPVFNRRRCEAYWKRQEFSNAKLKSMLGWEPIVSFEEACNRYFTSIREEKEGAC